MAVTGSRAVCRPVTSTSSGVGRDTTLAPISWACCAATRVWYWLQLLKELGTAYSVDVLTNWNCGGT